jgi:hypothetical protein
MSANLGYLIPLPFTLGALKRQTIRPIISIITEVKWGFFVAFLDAGSHGHAHGWVIQK